MTSSFKKKKRVFGLRLLTVPFLLLQLLFLLLLLLLHLQLFLLIIGFNIPTPASNHKAPTRIILCRRPVVRIDQPFPGGAVTPRRLEVRVVARGEAQLEKLPPRPAAPPAGLGAQRLGRHHADKGGQPGQRRPLAPGQRGRLPPGEVHALAAVDDPRVPGQEVPGPERRLHRGRAEAAEVGVARQVHKVGASSATVLEHLLKTAVGFRDHHGCSSSSLCREEVQKSLVALQIRVAVEVLVQVIPARPRHPVSLWAFTRLKPCPWVPKSSTTIKGCDKV
mmetsp:Transcript_7529/g.10504  ORF Transcript_7529/g.10504 Transcript_7529/m.10504 type:complete len:278 (+) Transcript_7529:82-915(+)